MYQKLGDDGIVIVEDFFDDPTQPQERDESYPKPLFSCSTTQANFITKTVVSRGFIFDGVYRSQESLGYDTYIQEPEKKKGSKPRLQLLDLVEDNN